MNKKPAKRLARALSGLLQRDKRRELAIMKRKARTLWRHNAFLWNSLIGSFSTMGRTPSKKVRPLSFNVLARMERSRRIDVLQRAFSEAGVRWPERKARLLSLNIARIEAMGGLRAEKRRLQACCGRDEMIGFLKSFAGIGDKYARNLLMDVYHPAFRDSVAIDARIQKVSRVVGVSFRRYKDAEEFYLKAARLAGIKGWDLDRLIYRYQREILARLDGKSSGSGNGSSQARK